MPTINKVVGIFTLKIEVIIWKYVQDRKVLFLYAKLKNRGT
nr:MAG TPA: hypothetical protein [Caudoviricetes sp.]